MAKKKAGRPPEADPKSVPVHVRVTADDYAAFTAECERLTEVTGQEWTPSGYLRMAGRAMIGKHLAGGGK